MYLLFNFYRNHLAHPIFAGQGWVYSAWILFCSKINALIACLIVGPVDTGTLYLSELKYFDS